MLFLTSFIILKSLPVGLSSSPIAELKEAGVHDLYRQKIPLTLHGTAFHGAESDDSDVIRPLGVTEKTSSKTPPGVGA